MNRLRHIPFTLKGLAVAVLIGPCSAGVSWGSMIVQSVDITATSITLTLDGTIDVLAGGGLSGFYLTIYSPGTSDLVSANFFDDTGSFGTGGSKLNTSGGGELEHRILNNFVAGNDAVLIYANSTPVDPASFWMVGDLVQGTVVINGTFNVNSSWDNSLIRVEDYSTGVQVESTLSTVPEPSSIIALAGLVLCFGVAGWRRHRCKAAR